jgi:hypothetical protein
VKERAMQQIQSNCQGMTSPWWGQNFKTNAQASQVANARMTSVATSQDVALNLTTTEGDTVSISMAASAQADYLKYLETGQDENGVYAHQLEAYSADSQQSFSMTVNGDLNQEELDDIGQALKIIDRMMGSFVQGRLEPVLAQAGKLAQLDTVSDLALDMSYTKSVLVVQQSQVQNAAATPNSESGSRSQLADAGRTSSSLAQSTQSQLSMEAAELSASMAKQLSLVKEFTKQLHSSVQQIFDKYRQRLQQSNSNDSFGTNLIDRIHDDLAAKLGE